MASFDLFLPILLRLEGGYVDDPRDPGGETNKGITMRTFQQCSHALLGLDPTSENLRGLTDAQTGIVYRTHYWNPMQGNDFALQELANLVCDFYVNSGTHATSLLQSTLNAMGGQVVVDGVLGPASVQALRMLDPVAVYRKYKLGRIRYYEQLGERYPAFLDGWLSRVNAFPNL
jgi:lysozyme family protein